MTKPLVLVTGTSGFVGMRIAAAALEADYPVRAVVRKSSQEVEIRAALETLGSTEHLQFASADLTADAGWADAMSGCRYVIHAASPLILGDVDDERVLLEPAVDGTRRVLEAAAGAGVERIVVTSTALTVCGHIEEGLAGPTDMTPVDYPGITLYTKSKILAQEEIESFGAAHPNGPSLTTIHPGVIIGPPLRRDEDSESIALFRSILDGDQPAVPDIAFPMADIRDVAELHVAALESGDADRHRYLVSFSEEPQSLADVARLLRADGYTRAPKRRIPMWLLKILARFNSELAGLVDSVKGRSMMLDISTTKSDFSWTPITFEQSVRDTARALQN